MTTIITVIGGPTALLELDGLRVLTDPTFDPPGDHSAGPLTLTKTIGPALSPADLGRVDLVLLSHDQHPDNLDKLGREAMSAAPLTLSTPEAAANTGATPLRPWQHHDVGGVRVTAVPALHGPPGSEPIVGQVTGFMLTGAEIPTIYVSGDNASLEYVELIAGRFPAIDVALLFGGAVRVPMLDERLTLNAAEMVIAARLLKARHVVPLHVEGWSHFTENETDVRTAFSEAGLGHLLVSPAPGRPVTLTPA
ncbi:MBL fold metallo-hydrolase [Sphaerisporangium siamense]|uniref:L-ascorbate metabolism protein UlaG (Beta-lactamase superfamily) n=1 Tax=Sphaerisporangium siamense TaxID=795645 RepID=A0A7W7G7L4_9ACTN|nr:MBL fold metallo-hydrolase [Sphaerisporangium siamense]MBB4698664.1 L-ascorbate metabolism protein UlaG (beta-lactamase superfamily) [Sphaerisporangium siamense]GII85277.1 MBL fold metallo-hydrolase [Sphaerisporangium siamense]